MNTDQNNHLQSQRPRRRIAVITAALLIPLTLIGILIARAQKPTSPTAPSANSTSGIRVKMISVVSQQSQDKIRISGRVEPWREATLAAEVGERVIALPIENGTRLAAGQTLAQLNDATARATLAQANASLTQATAARKQAEAEYARAVVETQAAVDTAKAQIAQADAGRAQAVAQATQATEGERKARSFTRAQELRQAEASLRQAEADERLQEQERDRYATLVREGAVGRQTLERVEAAHSAAAARTASAREAVSLAQEGAREEDVRTAAAGVEQAQAAVQNASARRQEAQAALTQASTRNTRLTVIRRQIDGLRAQEEQAAAAVRQARITASKHHLVAPFTGRILAKQTEVGEMLSPGTPVARLGEITRVKATFAVPEAFRLRLKPGQPISLTADALPGRIFTGITQTVGYQADSRTRSFPLEVRISNLQERLLPNMVVRLALAPAANTASSSLEVTVPVSAVASDGTTSSVFLVQDGKAVRRPVVLGAVRGERVVVVSGVVAGEQIIADPQRVTEGASVILLLSPPPPPSPTSLERGRTSGSGASRPAGESSFADARTPPSNEVGEGGGGGERRREGAEPLTFFPTTSPKEAHS